MCDLSSVEFERLALEALSETQKSPAGSRERLKSQRWRHYVQAYRGVPLDVLYRYRSVVHRDCHLFGYDCSPPEIFQGRRQGD